MGGYSKILPSVTPQTAQSPSFREKGDWKGAKFEIVSGSKLSSFIFFGGELLPSSHLHYLEPVPPPRKKGIDQVAKSCVLNFRHIDADQL